MVNALIFLTLLLIFLLSTSIILFFKLTDTKFELSLSRDQERFFKELSERLQSDITYLGKEVEELSESFEYMKARRALDSFDISKQPTEIWATYIPTRRPEFKIYNKRSVAKSSLSCNEKLGGKTWKENAKRVNKLYKLVDGKWIEQNE